MAFCPFHSNTDTPAFAIEQATGGYYCFSPACGRYGDDIVELVEWLTRRTKFEARRFVTQRAGESTEVDLTDYLEELFNKEHKPFPQSEIDRFHNDLWNSDGHEYMRSRGFEDETLKHFEVGYSKKKRAVMVPIHTYDGVPLGFQARLIDKKAFRFVGGFDMNDTLFNLHRAKRTSDRVVLVEAPYDAMRIHQAGFPNVVAIAGGGVGRQQQGLLDRHFTRIIYMPDNDDPAKYAKENCRKCDDCTGEAHLPGMELGKRLVKAMPHKEFYWTKPIDGKKDACDMQDAEVNDAVTNAESHFARQFDGL